MHLSLTGLEPSTKLARRRRRNAETTGPIPETVVCVKGDKTDRILPMVQQVPSTLPHTDLP